MLDHTRNIVRLLITDKRSLLLAKVLKKGFFFLPGGGIEYNESLYRAAQRELAEEVGVMPEAIKLIKPIGVYEHSWDDSGRPLHEMNIVCQCILDGFDSTRAVLSSEEHLAFEWVDMSNLSSIDVRPSAFVTLIPQWCGADGSADFFASSMAEPV